MGLINITSLLICKITTLETFRRCHLFKVSTLSLTERDLTTSKTYWRLLDWTNGEQIWQVLSVVRRRNNFLICGSGSCSSHVILIWKLSLKFLFSPTETRLCFWEVFLQIFLVNFWISRIVWRLNLLVFLQNFSSISESCLANWLIVGWWRVVSNLHTFFCFELSCSQFLCSVCSILFRSLSIWFFLTFSWFCRNFLLFCRTFSHLLWQCGRRRL